MDPRAETLPSSSPSRSRRPQTERAPVRRPSRSSRSSISSRRPTAPRAERRALARPRRRSRRILERGRVPGDLARALRDGRRLELRDRGSRDRRRGIARRDRRRDELGRGDALRRPRALGAGGWILVGRRRALRGPRAPPRAPPGGGILGRGGEPGGRDIALRYRGGLVFGYRDVRGAVRRGRFGRSDGRRARRRARVRRRDIVESRGTGDLELCGTRLARCLLPTSSRFG
jgi:hypothetical protein